MKMDRPYRDIDLPGPDYVNDWDWELELCYGNDRSSDEEEDYWQACLFDEWRIRSVIWLWR